MLRTDEKRTAPRVTTVVPVNCRVLGAGTVTVPSQRGAPPTRDFSAKTVNVSRDGLLINCDADLLLGTPLEVTLNAPTDGHVVRITADVAWSRRNSINLFGRYAAGLRIRKVSEADRKVLTDFFKPL
jgi:hypothetical protein